MTMLLLVTRPEPDNERTAAVLRAAGQEVLLAPMLQVEAIAGADFGPPPWSAVLMTSANAARALVSHPRRGELLALPAFAVGDATARAARAAGFANVVSAEGDGRDLARLVFAKLAGASLPLLYLAGEERARDLGGELSPHGLSVRTVAIYRAGKVRRFPPAVRDALVAGRVGGVLHFSRRSAEAYLDCGRDMIEAALAPKHFCLSARVAEPLRATGATEIRIASHPEEASLLALVAPAGPAEASRKA